MTRSKFKSIKELLMIFINAFFVYIGVSIITDYIFATPITTEMIRSTVWKAPFIAVILTIIFSMRNVISEEVKN